MKSIEINFNSLKDIFAKLGKNLMLLFFAAFLILAIFELFEIKQSVGIVLNAGQQPAPVVNHQQGVRIDFNNYNIAVQRIQDGQAFSPDSGATSSPFGNGQQ